MVRISIHLICSLLLIALCLGACQNIDIPMPTPTPVATIVTSSTTLSAGNIPELTEIASANRPKTWVETTINGIQVGCWIPATWQVDDYDGLVMVDAATDADKSMLIYVFAPATQDFAFPTSEAGTSYALEVLRQVVQMPVHIGADMALSEPVAFAWGDHDAAYYLLTSDDGVHALVLAITVPGEHKLVVLNISLSAQVAGTMRDKLPDLLDGLTINGVRLTGASLSALPDPLNFPVIELATTPERRG